MMANQINCPDIDIIAEAQKRFAACAQLYADDKEIEYHDWLRVLQTMTIKPHITDFYWDNRLKIKFCKVCSAEGIRLYDECAGPLSSTKIFFSNGCQTFTEEEFEEMYQNAIDQSKPKL